MKIELETIVINHKKYILARPCEKMTDNLYDEIKEHVEDYGGHWSERYKGFIFSLNKIEFKQETKEYKQWKEYRQYYKTPDYLADIMVELLGLDKLKEKQAKGERCRILEPSAGQGALIDSVLKKYNLKNTYLYAIEPDEYNLSVLDTKYTEVNGILKQGISFEKFYNLHKDDTDKLDRIIMNPPFSNGRALKHLRMACDLLADDGILVALISDNEIFYGGEDAKWVNEDLLMRENVDIIELSPDAFIESGTTILTSIIVINNDNGVDRVRYLKDL